MAQNLLSDKTTEQENGAPNKAPTSSSVAFRMPMEEKKEAIKPVVEKKVPPAIASSAQQKSANAPPAIKKSGGEVYTQPEALTQGFGVDLLGGSGEEKAKQLASPQKTIILLVGAAVLALTVVGVWRGILGAQDTAARQALSEADTAVATARTFLEGVAEERKGMEARFQNIDVVRTLLAGHTYWTRFFSFLEAITLPDVYYTNLAVDPSGRVRLAAIGRDFSAVARQLLAFDDSEDVETIRMTKAAAEVSGGQAGVQFDLEVAVKPALLFFQE